MGFIGADHLCIAHLAGWNIGADDKAGALLLVGPNDCLSGSDLGVNLPLNRLEGTRRGGPPFACIAFMGDDPAGAELMIAPLLGQRLQCGLRRLRRLKTFGGSVANFAQGAMKGQLDLSV